MNIRRIVSSFLILFLLGSLSPTHTEAQTSSLIDLTAAEAAQAIREGDITSEALVTALTDRIERYDYLNAFTLFDAGTVLEQARAADAAVQAGGALGALHGVPLIIKDNMDVAGLPTTAATPALLDNTAETNAPVVDALLDAGAIILGKANMHELALGSTGSGSAFGAVLNPYNPLLFPGGSSAGTAVAVAARLAPAGLGSDTAGSVRMPASMTGLYGFRPLSTSRWSALGVA